MKILVREILTKGQKSYHKIVSVLQNSVGQDLSVVELKEVAYALFECDWLDQFISHPNMYLQFEPLQIMEYIRRKT